MEVGDFIVYKINNREIVTEVKESNKHLLGCLNEHRSATILEASLVSESNHKFIEL